MIKDLLVHLDDLSLSLMLFGNVKKMTEEVAKATY